MSAYAGRAPRAMASARRLLHSTRRQRFNTKYLALSPHHSPRILISMVRATSMLLKQDAREHHKTDATCFAALGLADARYATTQRTTSATLRFAAVGNTVPFAVVASTQHRHCNMRPSLLPVRQAWIAKDGAVSIISTLIRFRPRTRANAWHNEQVDVMALRFLTWT